MRPQTLEGTWEEVARHAPELAGLRVRLIVLDSTSPPPMLDVALAELIEEAEQLATNDPPGQGAAWADGVDEFRSHEYNL